MRLSSTTHVSTSVVPANVVQPGIRVSKLDQEDPACVLYQFPQICRNINARRTNHYGHVLRHHASLDLSSLQPPLRHSPPPQVLPLKTLLLCHAGCWRNLLVPGGPCVRGSFCCPWRSWRVLPHQWLVTAMLGRAVFTYHAS